MIEYDPHRWRELLQWRGTMIVAINRRAGVVLLFAALVTTLHFHWQPLAVPETVHSLLGAALSLLLVFRTNASYDRFWEGRKLWGTIVNTSRNLTRLTLVHLAKDPVLAKHVLQMVIAFPYSSMNVLRGVRGIGPVEKDMDADVAARLLDSNHPPSAIAKSISVAFANARQQGMFSDFIQMEIDKQPALLIDCIGACERIHKTPLPFAYVVHLRRALVLYCGTLPFALLSKFGWGTIPISFLVAVVMFGIEEIGVEIEDPFGTDDNDLPLEGICAKIEAHVRSNYPTETA